MTRLGALLRRGLTTMAAMWPPIRTAYGWVHQVAQVLVPQPQMRADMLVDRP